MMRFGENCGSAYEKATGRAVPETSAVLPILFQKDKIG